MNTKSSRVIVAIVALSLSVQASLADDWTRFRGPQGAGVSTDTNVPLKWSSTENLRWKADLPGPGSSSPIVLGDQVFVTCYSGYGDPKSDGGSIASLQRHLVCVNRPDGQIRWTKTIAGGQPEDNYQGYIAEHGYASNTPVTDGERVYCFFGKTGVLAFDLEGNELWKTSVGQESSNRRWGSGSSLILYKDWVIVNASEESQSILALDKKTGKERWKATASAMELAYGTPALVTAKDNHLDLVLAVPGEVWGLNPDTGKLRWFAEHSLTGNVCPSVVANGDTVYVFGGFQSAGSFALQTGGEKNITKAGIQWSTRNSSYVATPVLYEGHLYWIDDKGQAYCVEAITGKLAYRERVSELESGGRPVYASPIVANGRIYVPSRWDGVLVLPAKPKYEVLAQNRFAGDESDFNATPAICNGELYLRSNRYLYCVSEQKP